MVGKQDPLYDDTLRLMERMVSSGVDAEMLLYRDFSHAFLSLDGVIPACIEAIEDSVNKIREMIKKSSWWSIIFNFEIKCHQNHKIEINHSERKEIFYSSDFLFVV